ncbi:hypothetical protein GLYMA_10G213000v4 [Glycine max]|uniref:uncharacterized protein isoform X2 n=1 Tax=Glycine max TaxID=3847 RepID=UPI0003DEACFD|nr:uncharacterized protein LOC102662800 isoform X2 [Glycine max]KAH1139383.1 hypothetical protein GYH30_028691 [Glycine max]KRH34905.2 hypothetical protein GLYMA_10G213000v4 [Glycine max]|eukprot:XP_006590196.1 uncharacterized protein LOC102662800 isoform X2 [Glycine max]
MQVSTLSTQLASNQEEAVNEESTLLQHEVDPYEEEETLSLSDLPIYSGASISARWGGDFSKEDGKNFVDDDDDNLFEFFSEEFTASSTNYATAENIIFCGKLIPFKDINPPRGDQSNINVQKGITKRSSKGSKSSFAASDYSSSVGKVSLVRSPTKSRWFLFMFGMSKLSITTEMELKDIRNRQSRRRRGPTATMMIPAAPENGKEEVAAVKEKRSSCKGMWKMFRSISMVLGCHSSNKIANDVVKAAFV